MAQVTVKKGLLIYVSFAQGATSDDVARAAKTLLSLPLCTLTGQWGDGRYLPPPPSPSLCVSAFLCLSVCLSICLSVCLSVSPGSGGATAAARSRTCGFPGSRRRRVRRCLSCSWSRRRR